MDKAFDRSRQLPEPLQARLWQVLEQMQVLLESAGSSGQAQPGPPPGTGVDIKALGKRHRLEKAVRYLLAMERPMSKPLRRKAYDCIDIILRTFVLVGDDIMAEIRSVVAEIKVVLAEAMSTWDDQTPDARIAVAEANDQAARAIMQWSTRGRDASPPKSAGRLVARRRPARRAAAASAAESPPPSSSLGRIPLPQAASWLRSDQRSSSENQIIAFVSSALTPREAGVCVS